MNRYKTMIKQTFLRSCLIFTIAVFVLYIAAYCAGGTILPSLPVLIGIYFCGLFISALTNIFRVRRLPGGGKFAIHFLGSTAIFALTILPTAGLWQKPVTAVIGILLFVGIYLITAAIVALIHVVRGKKHKQNNAYQNQFSGKAQR